MKGLSKKQEKALKCLQEYREKNGIMPTITELQGIVGDRHLGSTYGTLEGLQKKGILIIRPRESRGIVIIGENQKKLDAIRAELAKVIEDSKILDKKMQKIKKILNLRED